MKWIPDKTGRFARRPHYLPEELDAESEQLISAFLRQRHGKVEFPITTDDLTVFLEEKADLDSYADLSAEEGEVEGLTEFVRGQRPVVRIANRLNEPYLENRLRTTITHEYAHVHYHGFLFEAPTSGNLFPEHVQASGNKCKRDNMLTARVTGWSGEPVMSAVRFSCRSPLWCGLFRNSGRTTTCHIPTLPSLPMRAGL